MTTILPHGGHLVNNVLKANELERALDEASELPSFRLDAERTKDVRNICRGVYSPAEGFFTEPETMSVLADEHLVGGTPWTIPLVLDVPEDLPAKPGDTLTLEADDGEPLALMEVEDIYTWDKDDASRAVFGTDSTDHPGVRSVHRGTGRMAGGPLRLLSNEKEPFEEVNLDPWETRYLFKTRGYRTVAGFQTRNPPHMAHEAIQRTALSITDAIFVNPVIGRKKAGDFRDDVIISAYQALLANYYPKERAVLSILPYEMRYGGPKEAIMHAIIRKNYGCTHFIVGRDHAGVGDYYGEEEAIEKFAEFPDLGIEPLTVRGDFDWCKRCMMLSSDRTCAHPADERIPFSGTKVRKMVDAGQAPPPELMRPEVFEAINAFDEPFVTEADA